jgi:DUF3040 family protein
MALSMDEQRILDEIERRLADEDPALAARLTSFGHAGLASTLRSRRGRMLASLLAMIALAVISVAAYAVIPLGLRQAGKPRPAPASGAPVMTAHATGNRPAVLPPRSAAPARPSAASPGTGRPATSPISQPGDARR